MRESGASLVGHFGRTIAFPASHRSTGTGWHVGSARVVGDARRWCQRSATDGTSESGAGAIGEAKRTLNRDWIDGWPITTGRRIAPKHSSMKGEWPTYSATPLLF